MHQQTRRNRLLSRLTRATVATASLLALTGCYYEGGGHYGSHGDYGVHGGVYGGGRGPYHHRHHYKKLKPKEKAHLGYGPHAGHPHGGPPGQLKKHGYYY